MKLIPVVSTKAQVRIAQLLYKQLPAKEVSNYLLKISRHQITVDTSPKRTLTTLIYTPTELENDKDTPCIILYHGGALVLPPLLYHFRLARIFANNVHCKVMMPLYDLAPKYLPPLQHEEAYYFYKHLRENASEYNINPEKIVVAGDSAGGTLCAALCLMARDRNLPLPYAQMLFYPSLDASLSSESMKKYTDVPIVNAKAVREYYKMCRMDAYKGNRDYASPAEAESLKGMPPSYVETAEFDCLHDDGIKYANRLRDSGCDVVLNETRGTVHAFDMAKNSRILENVMQQRISFLRDVYGE